MNIKKQLWQEIESSQDEALLSKTLDFLKFLKTQPTNIAESKNASISTGKSLLKHLNSLSRWDGNDLEDCLAEIRDSRALAKFEDSNPFDEAE